MKRSAFIFYRSFWESIKDAPEKEFKAAVTALMSYALDGEENAEDFVAKLYLNMAKPQIDANNQRYVNGTKGGEYGRLGGRPKKAQENPKDHEEKPQENPTQTPNEYVNEKEYVKEKEKSRKEKEKPADVEAVVLNDGSEWRPTQEELDEYIRLYPGVDVPQAFRSMRGWCLANPKQAKTRAGVKRFVTGWLSREQNTPRVNRGKQQVRPAYLDRIPEEMEAQEADRNAVNELLKKMEEDRDEYQQRDSSRQAR